LEANFMPSGKKPKRPARYQYPPGSSPVEVGRLAGCSHVLASRLLRRGFTVEEIITRCERRREIEARRKAAAFPSVAVPVPTPEVNGHAASFAFHQARKERALADYRELQVLKARESVLPLEPFMALTTGHIAFQHRCLRLWPSDLSHEIAEQPQRRCAEILDRRIEHLIESSGAYTRAEAAKYGITPPPPEPPYPRRLSLYDERYKRDSRSGEIEKVPRDETFGSEGWLKRHPSLRGDGPAFYRILEAKRDWDERMSKLIAERGSWDIPDEHLPLEPEPKEEIEGEESTPEPPETIE
jgi:hypothetical protein